MATTNTVDHLAQILRNMLNAVGRGGPDLFAAVWPHVENVWNVTRGVVSAHPQFTIALVLLVFAVLLAHPIAKGVVRGILGFTPSGIKAGSLAAQIHSALHGGYVPAGSAFSKLQSFGALPL